MYRYLWLVFSVVWISSSIANTLPKNDAESLVQPKDEITNIDISNHYSLLWFRNSAEQKAVYRQIFANSFDKIENKIEEDNLKPKSWGVVIALDGTLLDDSGFYYQTITHSLESNISNISEYQIANYLDATPGAADFTCHIQDDGGRVFIVSNRSTTPEKTKSMIDTTVQNLKQENICFDNVIFANDASSTNKNPRFNAILSGDYENIITNAIKPATNIVAFIGNDIQDFPDLKQNLAHDLDGDDEYFDKFGDTYFLLPNPTIGSWQDNSLQ